LAFFLNAMILIFTGVFVCGNSTTNSGLTVTLTKDGKTNGNEYTLEAGALVLGDQGTCCIDEFDKMSGQHQVSILSKNYLKFRPSNV
jgi:DNA helicase MCM8